MKRITICFLAMMLSAIAFADSRVTVAPLDIREGRQAQLMINYEFDEGHSICNYQMEVQLPEGITVVGTDVALGDSHSGHTGSIVNNIIVVTSMNSVISGTSGLLLKVTVEASTELAVGSKLKGSLHNIKLGQLDETSINQEDVDFDIEIVEDVLVLDETSATAPAAEESANVRVRRTINANEWSTICLPFGMTAAQVQAAFNNGDVQLLGLAEFKGWETTEYDNDDNATAIQVSFSGVDAIAANTPYIIKVSKAITEFTVDGVDIDPEDEPMVSVGKMNKGTFGSFTGSYVPMTIDEECLFLSDGKFWYSTGKTAMKGYRAYFYFQDVLADYSGSASSARISMRFADGTTTGVGSIDNGETESDSYYDLQGRKIEKPVRKGLYIRGGKKIVK